ncbi:alpha-L-fucosidase [Candidatus Poribacteria bacterium]|nr:alpha-L-fucosidase [Candidatus Poribacteria bacterium]
MAIKPEATAGNTDWFIHDRFGLFIHWGLYALPARHEWVKNRERIPDSTYQKYFEHFDPDLYDPKEWAKAAKKAGMKYFVVTTKHHEGFCLWDSKLTDYKATNTPAGRDLLKPMVEAFREEGLKIGFYHSLIDWHHPEFPVDGIHPQRDDKEFREKEKDRDITKYAEYLHKQTRELLTQFGKIDIIWFDFSYSGMADNGKGKDDWQSEKLLDMVRELMPGIIVNDRLEIGGDIKTPEQVQPREWVKVDGKPVVWEACQTLNGSWGYDRDNLDWKSVELLVQMLIDTVSKGGNLLLNVGPTGRGYFDPKAIDRLEGIGEWMKYNSRSIYGASQSEFTAPVDCRLTQNGDRLYIHVFAWPFKQLHMEGMAGKIKYAQLLHDASEVRYSENMDNGMVSFNLPVQRPDVVVPVIELFLK